MTVVETLIPAAFRLGRERFVARFVGYHLLKPPAGNQELGMGYQTLEAQDPREHDPSHILPSPKHWQASKIEKRPGNPYPERISVGRATNCDVVLRFGVVSKLHAHFMLSAMGTLSLVDLGSSNGTWHNGIELSSGEEATINPGDTLSFGGVRCEIVDGAGLYELVTGNRR